MTDFQQARERLERVSPVMRDMLRAHSEWAAWLQERAAQPVDAAGFLQLWEQWRTHSAGQSDTLAALRTFKQREYIDIALRDLSGTASFEETVQRLSFLAGWVISVTLEEAWNELADNVPRSVRSGEGFSVLALGKLGGGELNYSSDVDLIFCRRTSDDEAELRFFTRLGERLVRLLGQAGPQGFLYRVDMRLRPHGDTGPLVPTVESLENYYESWGEAWERQALIKANPICGDQALGARFRSFAAHFTFARQIDDSSLEEIKRVKHRSEKEYARPSGRIHIKQGPGGIRDIEFYVQYLQLIAGSRYPEVRAAATLDAIRELARVKALLEGEESQLSVAYRFLRTVEHRLQLRLLTPQALIPEQADELEGLARDLGFHAGSQRAAGRFLQVLEGHRKRVRTILERIYLTPGYLRPAEQTEEFAQLLSERTPKDRVRRLLSQYGFQDAEKAWQNIRLMALGPAGRLLPPGERRAFLEIVFPLLEVLRDSLDPDQALHHLESFAAASGNRVSFLRALASRRPHLARICNLLALSNLGHQILCRHPEYFDSLARGIHLHEGRTAREMTAELEERLRLSPAGEDADVLRRYRQREMVRISYRDLAGLADPLAISAELSDLAEAVLCAALRRVCLQFPSSEGPAGQPEGRFSGEPAGLEPDLQVVALGKLGSRQMHYSSDLDLLFLYDDLPPEIAAERRTQRQRMQDARVERLLELLTGVTPEGIAYKVDLRLRPEGASGLLARSWSGFLEYARHYMQPWERLALVRSRMPGDSEARRSRWARTLAEIVYGYQWDEQAVEAVRHLKRRIEAETSRESRAFLDFKFGRGGIADLEFLVKLLQARIGGAHDEVRAPAFPGAVEALHGAGALTESEARQLLDAHRFQRRVENHFQLMEEWASREVSRESPLLDRLARSLNYREGTPEEARKAFLADWERHAAIVRNLVDIHFYGKSRVFP